MRRPLLVTTTALALLLTAGGIVSAQDEADETAVGDFTSAGTLTLARSGHSATLLPDGRVLISGGEGLDAEDLDSAEVWDPSTSSFGPADELAEPILGPVVEAELERTDHTATLLPDGRGLIIGGGTDEALLAEAELIDPRSGATVPAGTLADPRTGHTATFLRDGRVLVVGGSGADGPLASAELWTSARKPAKCLGKRPTLFAQPGVELVGSRGDDVIAGSVGDDRIAGGGGDDRICGYDGDDTIDGGGGKDAIDAGPGSDLVTGGGGNDRLTGSRGDDELDGGKGKDVCVGGKGTDWLPGCNEAKKTRGTVVVNKNTKLKGPHKGVFIIGRNGVTLDCDGHTVTGAGKGQAPPGVFLGGRKNVTVRNCDLREHDFGFKLERSRVNTLVNNRVSQVGEGFNLSRSDKNRLIGNVVSHTGYSGYALEGGSDANTLSENLAEMTTHFGFIVHLASGRNTFSDNTARLTQNAGFAALSGDNTFSDNTSTDNAMGFQDTTTGPTGDSGTANQYSSNVCRANRHAASEPRGLCSPGPAAE